MALEQTAKNAGVLAKIGSKIGLPVKIAGVIGGILTTYGISEWAILDNSKTSLNLAAGKIEEEMRYNPEAAMELLEEYNQISDEIYNYDAWETIARAIPFTNLAINYMKASKAVKFQKKVTDTFIQNQAYKYANGLTDAELKKEEFNQMTKDLLERDMLRREAQRIQDELDNELAELQRNEDAEFWKEYHQELLDMEAEYKEEQRELEKKQDEEVAQFWLNYFKLKMEMEKAYWDRIKKDRAESQPSKLGFGLL